MPERPENLQRLLDLLGRAMKNQAAPGSRPQALIEEIFNALATTSQSGGAAAATIPVCEHLQDGFANARRQDGEVGAVAEALADLAPQLCWRNRPGSKNVAPDFSARHGNALIVGADGLEKRDDVRIGVSLVAPGTRYPDHHHPPEEIYFALSPGEWRQEDGPWRAPGPGGLVHNPPNIVHAMRAAAGAPLLAIWCLLI